MDKAAAAAVAETEETNASVAAFADRLTSQLEGVAGTEVIVSVTSVPPHTTCPKHWHPGEEFAYVLEGSFTLWQEGKPDEVYRKGDVGKVPLKQVHTIFTKEESAKILVFRVHEQGEPELTLVE
jgi:quercetin dioxygenase-like cupin family protein